MSVLPNKKDWKDVQIKLMEDYPALVEEDFNHESDDELIIHLQQKLGKTREELREIIRKI